MSTAIAPVIYAELQPCAWGDRRPGCRCPHMGGYGIFTNFCQKHADVLKRVREEFQDDTLRHGLYAQRVGVRRRMGGRASISTCCTKGCYNPRDPSEAYCAECLDAGVGVHSGE